MGYQQLRKMMETYLLQTVLMENVITNEFSSMKIKEEYLRDKNN